MNNEPVAWINRKGKDGEHGYLEWDKDDEAEINTPLYTHPAKTLTDHIAELEKELKRTKFAWNLAENEIEALKYEISSSAWNSEELTDQEIFNIYAYLQDTYEGDNFPVAVGREIIKRAKEK